MNLHHALDPLPFNPDRTLTHPVPSKSLDFVQPIDTRGSQPCTQGGARGTGKDAESFSSKVVINVMTFVIQLLQFFVLVIFYNLSAATGNIEQNYISVCRCHSSHNSF